jgi:heat-inducible transcriptional repressor
MRQPEISDRQREILFKTLELYISTGCPVGSHALTETVDASSSTIRAELSYLESEGLLTHPHTSAGRVPTDAGYRYYVDALMAEDPREAISFEAPQGPGNLDELLRSVSEGMSEVTRLLAVVAGPSALGDSLSRVDYLQLPGGTLLLVVSMESGASSSTTVALPAYVGEDELREIFAALNSWLGGRPVGGEMDLATVARKALSDHNPLVAEAVLEAVEVLGRATERRRWLLRLMGDALQRSAVSNSGVVVSIGAENAFYNLVGTSLVAAAYTHRERPYGVVSLIGPKRMDYDAAISTVRSAAEALTVRLSTGF